MGEYDTRVSCAGRGFPPGFSRRPETKRVIKTLRRNAVIPISDIIRKLRLRRRRMHTRRPVVGGGGGGAYACRKLKNVVNQFGF